MNHVRQVQCSRPIKGLSCLIRLTDRILPLPIEQRPVIQYSVLNRRFLSQRWSGSLFLTTNDLSGDIINLSEDEYTHFKASAPSAVYFFSCCRVLDRTGKKER